MTALYRGERVRIVRLAGTRALIIWRNMLKRVNRAELEERHEP